MLSDLREMLLPVLYEVRSANGAVRGGWRRGVLEHQSPGAGFQQVSQPCTDPNDHDTCADPRGCADAARSQAPPHTLARHHLFVSPTICFGKNQKPLSLSSPASHPPHILLVTSTCRLPSLIHISFPPGFIFLPNIFSVPHSTPRERLYL